MTVKKTKRPKLGARIIAGLEDAVAHAKGERSGVVVHAPTHVDVKAIRARTGLTQAAFARRYGFTLDSVQNWEAGRRKPEAAARLLLTVIAKEPAAVERALKSLSAS
jgi:putative transcriptional regulator